jgi:hypothetical protein
MERRFKVGDHVTWNSEAGHVSGKIIKVHTKNVDYKGYTHHASPMIRNTKSRATRPTTSRCTKVMR